MFRRLTARPVAKPEWGSTRLEPWFPNSREKVGEMWFAEPGDPLLIKFLFTTGKLSVQVHPDDAYASEHHNSRGKTEMWHILAAEPGAQIAAGFREEISPERLRASAISGEIEQLLAWHDARPGDTFFIPAGTVHAIGPGLVLCEIQENCDLTYRLYDYGRPRELHLDHAARVSLLGAAAARQPAREGVLVDCPYFTAEKHRVSGRLVLDAAGRTQSLVILEGELQIGGQQAREGDVLRSSEAFDLTGDATLLRILTPNRVAG
jgi:mannose-6-phosphate isomerase